MAEKELEGAVVPKPPDDLPANEVHGPSGLAGMIDDPSWLLKGDQGGDLADDDPFASIIRQILSATSPDIVLTPVEATQARDVVGVPLEVFDFAMNKSEFDTGAPFYASMQCQKVKTGEPVVVNCGHKAVIAQLIRLKQLDAYPFAGVFEERGRSAQGTPMLRLKRYESTEGEPPPF
jgi:hypothetical protein